MSRENCLFLGNPGTGKSTLINCLIGAPELRSGLSYGGGLTQDYHRVEHNGVAYMDTPGLADRTIADQAAEAITTALKQGGRYKLFFMLRLQNGRVVCEDMATLERVLDAIAVDASALAFSIVFNNVNKKQYAMLTQPGSQECESVKRQVNSRHYKTSRICFVPAMPELYEQEDKVAPLPPHVQAFVEAAPVVLIDPRTVRAINVTDFAQHTAAIQEEIDNALKERDAVMTIMATNHSRFQEEMERQRTAHKAESDRLRYLAMEVPGHAPLSPTGDYARSPPLLPLGGVYDHQPKRWGLTKMQMIMAVLGGTIVVLLIVIIVLATRGNGGSDAPRATKQGCVSANDATLTRLDPPRSVNDLAVIASYESHPYFMVLTSERSVSVTYVAFSDTLPTPPVTCSSDPAPSTLSVYAVPTIATNGVQATSAPPKTSKPQTEAPKVTTVSPSPTMATTTPHTPADSNAPPPSTPANSPTNTSATSPPPAPSPGRLLRE